MSTGAGFRNHPQQDTNEYDVRIHEVRQHLQVSKSVNSVQKPCWLMIDYRGLYYVPFTILHIGYRGLYAIYLGIMIIQRGILF